MCGIIGIYQTNKKLKNAARLAAYCLFAEQHRGQESCGIAYTDNKKLSLYKDLGWVKAVFTEDRIKNMPANIAIGHVRYPTQGLPNLNNAQPHIIHTLSGPNLSLASNGDITNYYQIRKYLEKNSVFFESNNDGELLLKYLAFWYVKKNTSIIDAIKYLMRDLRGSYSSLLLTEDHLYAFRDPYGNRPFIFGQQNNGSYIFASESCCLNIIKAKFVREVKPAEIISISNSILQSFPQNPNIYREKSHNAHCIFELIYFSRADSMTFGHNVYEFREKIGKKLGEQETIIPDVVVPVPDSSNFIGLSYAKTIGAEFSLALKRNYFVGRTFIAPKQKLREEKTRQKYNPLPGFFKDKIVTLVDDSIVRGTTLKKIVKMIKDNGAKKVHVRIGSPMIKSPCFYGIDIHTKQELIAGHKSIQEIREFLHADSLRYLSISELKKLVDNPKDFCYACFNGKYPIKIFPNMASYHEH